MTFGSALGVVPVISAAATDIKCRYCVGQVQETLVSGFSPLLILHT